MPSISDIRWPLAANTIKRGNMATFGMVRTKIVNGQVVPKPHQGWDLFATPGTQCFAVADGKVVRVIHATNNGHSPAYGSQLVIKLEGIQHDGRPVYAMYAHLSGFAPGIIEGVDVQKGQFVCMAGTTGNAHNLTGIHRHLHFEFRHISAPGLGLANRFDPAVVYGPPPLNIIHAESIYVCAA
jgi:murein DD-endopeptidase MepM/ murein hydrolase activator NlpD